MSKSKSAGMMGANASRTQTGKYKSVARSTKTGKEYRVEVTNGPSKGRKVTLVSTPISLAYFQSERT